MNIQEKIGSLIEVIKDLISLWLDKYRQYPVEMFIYVALWGILIGIFLLRFIFDPVNVGINVLLFSLIGTIIGALIALIDCIVYENIDIYENIIITIKVGILALVINGIVFRFEGVITRLCITFSIFFICVSCAFLIPFIFADESNSFHKSIGGSFILSWSLTSIAMITWSFLIFIGTLLTTLNNYGLTQNIFLHINLNLDIESKGIANSMIIYSSIVFTCLSNAIAIFFCFFSYDKTKGIWFLLHSTFKGNVFYIYNEYSRAISSYDSVANYLIVHNPHHKRIPAYYLKIADCYKLIKRFEKAGEYFEMAGRYREAGKCYMEAALRVRGS